MNDDRGLKSEKRIFKQHRNVLIGNFNIELLFGLAESRTVELGGHFDQVIATEEKVSFTGRFRALKGQTRGHDAIITQGGKHFQDWLSLYYSLCKYQILGSTLPK